CAGFERLTGVSSAPRHRHVEAYATIVLAGDYEQYSYAGRLRVGAGDVVIQPSFDCHADLMLSASLWIVRLHWRRDESLGGVYHNLEIDEIARAAKRDVVEATELLKSACRRAVCAEAVLQDWADKLARDLAANPRLRIAEWARSHGISREHISRRFSADFGVSPAQFRSELNARAAWSKVTGTRDSLSAIADDLGFADQAHMTRAVTALTGVPPARWRRSHSFKTAYPAAAITQA
ncbi:MAG TPA: AraC family transcriptional regulator, partial [Rhizomicrobium sp.]|nr:AraC family transcriptional regulator [Rhizomicrobium sp.]